MQCRVIPWDFKQTLVNPLIKKQTLHKNDLKNYRPISNLIFFFFLSKVLEKVVANRLYEHIDKHHITSQSAYKDSTLPKRLFSTYTMI